MHHRLACLRLVPGAMGRSCRGVEVGHEDTLRSVESKVYLYIFYLPLIPVFFNLCDKLIFHRKYPEVKLQENIDSEIMDVLLQEARDSYDENIVVELKSNTTDEMDNNVDRIEAWVKQWKQDNPGEGGEDEE